MSNGFIPKMLFDTHSIQELSRTTVEDIEVKCANMRIPFNNTILYTKLHTYKIFQIYFITNTSEVNKCTR